MIRRALFVPVLMGGGAKAPYTIFNGNNTIISCGSDASLDDLHDAELTAELWIKELAIEASGTRFLEKGSYGSAGWNLLSDASGRLTSVIAAATTIGLTITPTSFYISSAAVWTHVAMYFNDAGDRKVYFAKNGVWAGTYTTQTAAVDAVVTDAASNFIIGNRSAANTGVNGYIGWVRLSNNDRYSHGTPFTPPARTEPPAVDANTIEQWNMDEGTGTTVAAQVNAANNGTLTNGTWGEG